MKQEKSPGYRNCERPLTQTELAHEMGYKEISRKLKNAVEVLLRSGKIESFLHERQIKYRKKF